MLHFLAESDARVVFVLQDQLQLAKAVKERARLRRALLGRRV